MLVYGLRDWESTTREELYREVAERTGMELAEVREKAGPRIEAALEEGTLVEDSEGRLSTANAATQWTMTLEVGEEAG